MIHDGLYLKGGINESFSLSLDLNPRLLSFPPTENVFVVETLIHFEVFIRCREYAWTSLHVLVLDAEFPEEQLGLLGNISILKAIFEIPHYLIRLRITHLWKVFH